MDRRRDFNPRHFNNYRGEEMPPVDARNGHFSRNHSFQNQPRDKRILNPDYQYRSLHRNDENVSMEPPRPTPGLKRKREEEHLPINPKRRKIMGNDHFIENQPIQTSAKMVKRKIIKKRIRGPVPIVFIPQRSDVQRLQDSCEQYFRHIFFFSRNSKNLPMCVVLMVDMDGLKRVEEQIEEKHLNGPSPSLEQHGKELMFYVDPNCVKFSKSLLEYGYDAKEIEKEISKVNEQFEAISGKSNFVTVEEEVEEVVGEVMNQNENSSVDHDIMRTTMTTKMTTVGPQQMGESAVVVKEGQEEEEEEEEEEERSRDVNFSRRSESYSPPPPPPPSSSSSRRELSDPHPHPHPHHHPHHPHHPHPHPSSSSTTTTVVGRGMRNREEERMMSNGDYPPFLSVFDPQTFEEFKFPIQLIRNYAPNKKYFRNQVCILFLNGRCKWGSSCRHVHVLIRDWDKRRMYRAHNNNNNNNNSSSSLQQEQPQGMGPYAGGGGNRWIHPPHPGHHHHHGLPPPPPPPPPPTRMMNDYHSSMRRDHHHHAQYYQPPPPPPPPLPSASSSSSSSSNFSSAMRPPLSQRRPPPSLLRTRGKSPTLPPPPPPKKL